MHAMPECILVAVSQLTEHALKVSAEQWLFFLVLVIDAIFWVCKCKPICIGPEGSGKGIILSHLLLPLFDKCGLHCNKFDTTLWLQARHSRSVPGSDGVH